MASKENTIEFVSIFDGNKTIGALLTDLILEKILKGEEQSSQMLLTQRELAPTMQNTDEETYEVAS